MCASLHSDFNFAAFAQNHTMCIFILLSDVIFIFFSIAVF